MLLSLLRLTRWQGRRLTAFLLVSTYAWAFAALDITHTHASPRPQARWAAAPASLPIPATGHALTHAKAGAPETPCPVCAAVHAASVALVQPPAPVRATAPVQLVVSRLHRFAPTAHVPTLHRRGPPTA